MKKINTSHKMEDFDQDFELNCPKCGHSPLHNRDCSELFCDDGLIDESNYDPINCMEGESLFTCPECKGTGVEWWCPNCGENLSGRIHTIENNDF